MSVDLRQACGFRHGVVLPVTRLAPAPADLDQVWNCSVAYGPDDPWRSAGGGCGFDRDRAELAAIAEALERYAAVNAVFDVCSQGDVPSGEKVLGLGAFSLFDESQRAQNDFPHKAVFEGDPPLVAVYSMSTNERCWAPAALVGLTDAYGELPTSSGLAAAPTAEHALLRAVEELVERDALMATWLHQVEGRRVELSAALAEPVEVRRGRVVLIDATPAYSPHPVAIVAGHLPLHGRPRYSLGAACRANWVDAIDKAYVEWSQGVTFAGHRLSREPALRFDGPGDVRTFDDHAVYYTCHPDRWDALALERGPRVDPPCDAADGSLASLVASLGRSGIELYYRDLTPIDLAQLGLRVVRVLAPMLTPIHADHRWPHWGGRTADLDFRYPGPRNRALRNPTHSPAPPHPLG